MEVPAKLNGYPVIRSKVHANCATVVVQRETSIHENPLVVCTWWPKLGSTWMWGHYGYNDETVKIKFNQICASNEGR